MVYDLDDWVLQEVEWQSPLHADLAGWRGALGSRLVARAAGPESALLAGAARRAFQGLAMGTLKRLHGHLGCEGQARTLYEVVKSLVEFALPELGEEEVLAILQKRLLQTGIDGMALLQTEEVQEVLGDNVQEVEQHIDDSKKKEAALDEHKAAVQGWAAAVQSKKLRSAKSKGTSRGSTRSVPAEAVSQDRLLQEEGARSLLPPGAALSKDFANGRWLATHRGSSRSRSWALHGEEGALRQVLQFVWNRHTQLFGEQCPYEWVLRE